MPEPVGLTGYAAGDFLQIAGHVRELNPKAADPVRKLVDQAFAIQRRGRGNVQFCGLRN